MNGTQILHCRSSEDFYYFHQLLHTTGSREDWISIIIACTDAIGRSKNMSLLPALETLGKTISECLPKAEDASNGNDIFREDTTGIAVENSPGSPTHEKTPESARWQFLRQFVKAWSMSPSAILHWCRSKPEYPLEFHVNLLCNAASASSTNTNPRQAIASLQKHLASYAQTELDK